MSRLTQAWNDSCPSATASDGQRPGLEHRPIGRRSSQPAASSTNQTPPPPPALAALLVRLLGVITASLLLAGLAAPSSALANTSHNQTHAQTQAVGVVVLAFGAGYQTPDGSARVKTLQHQLTTAGFYPGPVDGRYGPLTQQAVRRLQAAAQITTDAIAGPVTQHALADANHGLYPGAGLNGPSSPRVKTLQHQLTKAGYHPGPIDGRYGPHTQHAVRAYQQAHQLKPTGTATPQTLKHLNTPTQTSKHPSQHPNPQKHPNTSPHPTTTTARHATPTAPPALLLVAIALTLGLLATTIAYHQRRQHWQHQHQDQDQDQDGWRTTPWTTNPNPTTADDPERIYQHALTLQQQGHHQAAQAAYQHADQLGHPAAAANLGAIHEQQGQHHQAQAAYQRADHRGDPNGAFNLALTLEQQGNHTAAQAAYQRADQRGHPKAAANLGVLLETQGDHQTAQTYYRKADQQGDPNGTYNLAVSLQEQGDPIGALHAYQKATQTTNHQIKQMAQTAKQQLQNQLQPTTTQGARNH